MPDQSSAATEHAILQEITRPLEALPDDPLSVVNAEFPTALRGYDRVAVDDYVRRTRQLVAELQATRSPEAAVRRALERVGDQISGILQRAHTTAEQITAQSRSEAEDRLEQARVEAAQIAGAAEQRVRDLDADTDRIWLERQRIVSDAEDLAQQLLALAKTASERFPADTESERQGDRDTAEAGQSFEMSEPVEAPQPFDAQADEAPGDAGSWLDEDEDVPEFFEPAPRAAADRAEVEETVAFQPLSRHEDETGERAAEDETDEREAPQGRGARAGAEDEPADDEASQGGSRRSDEDDTTKVIRPASEAASRRSDNS